MAAKKLIETARAEMSAPRRDSLGGPDDMTEVGTEWTAAALQQGGACVCVIYDVMGNPEYTVDLVIYHHQLHQRVIFVGGK